MMDHLSQTNRPGCGSKSCGTLKKSRPHVKPGAAHQTRPGDWAMRMRFWGENTREIEAGVCKRLPTRAFHPKARSHSPITAPSVVRVRNFESTVHIHSCHTHQAIFEFPLPAYPTAGRISRVIRFAKVKEENAKRAPGHVAKRIARLIHPPPTTVIAAPIQ